jgi:PAS domain S-box-containing protein
VVISDRHGRIVLVNRETERMFGYSRAHLLGQAVEVLVPERFRRGHVRHRDGYLANPSMRSLGAANRCLLGRRQDGTEFPTEIGLSYVETGDGILVMSAIADASQRRQADEALRKTSETLQALVQASPVGIAILDPDGRVEMWNPAAERIFGWSADEVLGQALPTIPEGKEEEHRTLRERVLKGGASNGVELQRRAKDGAAA